MTFTVSGVPTNVLSAVMLDVTTNLPITSATPTVAGGGVPLVKLTFRYASSHAAAPFHPRGRHSEIYIAGGLFGLTLLGISKSLRAPRLRLLGAVCVIGACCTMLSRCPGKIPSSATITATATPTSGTQPAQSAHFTIMYTEVTLGF